MTDEEYKKLIDTANEVHRRTLETVHYLPIPEWWFEEEEENNELEKH